jgi:hypothetical protein
MKFAIDFDRTFSRDPELFRQFVALLRGRGHEAVLVTGRSDDGQWGADVRSAVGDLMPIVFAGTRWKRQAAIAAGHVVDVWIDDMPEYIAPQNHDLAMHKGAPAPPMPPALATLAPTIETPFDDWRHRRSEEIILCAEMMDGRPTECQYAEAAQLEEEAALAVPTDMPHARSVLAVSAVSLWLEGRQPIRAARCAAEFLAKPERLTADGIHALQSLTETVGGGQSAGAIETGGESAPATTPTVEMRLFTDTSIIQLGDAPGREAPIREVEVCSFDGDRYARVRVDGMIIRIEAGLIYTAVGRFGEVLEASKETLFRAAAQAARGAR